MNAFSIGRAGNISVAEGPLGRYYELVAKGQLRGGDPRQVMTFYVYTNTSGHDEYSEQ